MYSQEMIRLTGPDRPERKESVPEATAAAVPAFGWLLVDNVAEPSGDMAERTGRKISLGNLELFFGKIEPGLLDQLVAFFRQFSYHVFAESLLIDDLSEKGAG